MWNNQKGGYTPYGNNYNMNFTGASSAQNRNKKFNHSDKQNLESQKFSGRELAQVKLCSTCFPKNCSCGYRDGTEDSGKTGWSNPNDYSATDYSGTNHSSTNHSGLKYTDTNYTEDSYTEDTWTNPEQNNQEIINLDDSDEETPETESKPGSKPDNSIKSSFLDMLDAAEDNSKIPKETRPVMIKSSKKPILNAPKNILNRQKTAKLLTSPVSQLRAKGIQRGIPKAFQKGPQASCYNKKSTNQSDISNIFYSGKNYKPTYEPKKQNTAEDEKIIDENERKIKAMHELRSKQYMIRKEVRSDLASPEERASSIADKKLRQLEVYNNARRPDRRFARTNVFEEKNQTWDGLNRNISNNKINNYSRNNDV